jgi:superoxide dismutase, Cu-Zn family
MKRSLLFVALGGLAAAAHAQVTVDIKAIDEKGSGASLGQVVIAEARKGVTLTPKLKGLSPGPHGFHVHTNGDCGPKEKDGKMVPGDAAGPHWDPDKAGKHGSPHGDGHRGDMPVLEVAKDGTATKQIRAPRLKLADLDGKALMIHEGGDNYADMPKPLGGGGKRIACGVIQVKR